AHRRGILASRGDRRKDHVRRGALTPAYPGPERKEQRMTAKSATWTYYDGRWQEGDVRILGAASHATWLGSLVFDGARLFEGVAPDLDLHSARVNESARALGLEPRLSAGDIEALTREGLKKFSPGTDVYIRP